MESSGASTLSWCLLFLLQEDTIKICYKRTQSKNIYKQESLTGISDHIGFWSNNRLPIDQPIGCIWLVTGGIPTTARSIERLGFLGIIDPCNWISSTNSQSSNVSRFSKRSKACQDLCYKYQEPPLSREMIRQLGMVGSSEHIHHHSEINIWYKSRALVLVNTERGRKPVLIQCLENTATWSLSKATTSLHSN